MTATVHHALVALDERIRILKNAIRALESANHNPTTEAELEEEIERLKERLAMMRRHRESRVPVLEARKKEMDNLVRLRDACAADVRVADAFWMTLQVQRTKTP